MWINQPDFIDLGPDTDPWLDERGNPILELDEEDVTTLIIESWSASTMTMRPNFGHIEYDVASDRLLSIWRLDDAMQPRAEHVRPMSFARPAWDC